MSLYAELNVDDELLDIDESARYCRPSTYDRGRCEPKVSAFFRRRYKDGPCKGMPSENGLSVSRIQYFQLSDRTQAVECVRQEYRTRGYDLRRNGRFVVFNVGAARATAMRVGYQLSFLYTPDPPLHSHSLIFDLPDDLNEERKVATALKRLISREDTYDAVP